MPDDATVATPAPDYELLESIRELPRRLMVGAGRKGQQDGGYLSDQAGERARYLPQLHKEDGDDYEFRRDHLTVVPPWYPDAVDNVTSAILSGPVVLDESVPEEMAAFWRNVDRKGKDGNVFAARVERRAVAEGQAAILADYHAPLLVDANGEPAEPGTRSEELALGGGPKWVRIEAGAVLECLCTTDSDGNSVKLRVKIQETAHFDVGEWGRETVDRIRVLKRGDPSRERSDPERYCSWALYEKNKEGKWVPAVARAGEQTSGHYEPARNLKPDAEADFVEIPFYWTYGEYVSEGVGYPPLRHQARLIQLWVLKDSDFNALEHYSVPMQTVDGLDRKTFEDAQGGAARIGKGNTVFTPSGSFGIVEPQGTSFDKRRASLQELTEKIREAGRDPLRKQATGKELATLGLIDKEQKMTRLEVDAEFLKMALNQAWKRAGYYLGIELTEDQMLKMPKPNATLMVAPMARSQMLDRAAQVGGLIDVRTYWEQQKELGMVGESLDPDEVAARVAEGGTEF